MVKIEIAGDKEDCSGKHFDRMGFMITNLVLPSLVTILLLSYLFGRVGEQISIILMLAYGVYLMLSAFGVLKGKLAIIKKDGTNRK